GQVLVAHAAARGECDLMGPVSIHHRFAEFAFTIHEWPLRKWSPPRARRYFPRTGKDAFTERRAAWRVFSRMRTKREHKFETAAENFVRQQVVGTLYLCAGLSPLSSTSR